MIAQQETTNADNSAIMLYAAPLQSHTTAYYRLAYHQTFGNIHKYFTPFFEERKQGGYIPKLLPELSADFNQGLYVVPQVLTNKPDFLAEFANKVGELGYSEINLNMGCPHPPVWRKGTGSGLLQTPDILKTLLESHFKETPQIKLSIKMRLGITEETSWQQIIPVLNDFPLHEVIIHPRTAKQYYTGTPNWDEFEKMITQLQHPIVGNGNINSLSDFNALKERFPNVTRWMIGRGWLTNPWLAASILTGMEQQGSSIQFRKLFENYYDLVTTHVTDINVKRNLYHNFWHYPTESIKGGVKWRRALGKKTSLVSYSSMVNELLTHEWLNPKSDSSML